MLSSNLLLYDTYDHITPKRYSICDLQDPDQMDKDLVCAICQDLVYVPLECSQCQHVFCTECIEDWQKKRNKCPFDCRGPLELQQVHRFVKNSLMKLKVQCKECKEKFQLDYSETHEKECRFALTKCDHFGCQYIGRRKSMEKHKNRCEFSDNNNCKKCIFLKDYFTQEMKKTQQELIDCKKLLKIEIQEKGKLLQLQQKQCSNSIQFCTEGHELSIFNPGYNVVSKKYNQNLCKICNVQKYCRLRCDYNNCLSMFCIECRPLNFNRGQCPNKHKLRPSTVTDQVVCDMCEQGAKGKFTCTMCCPICQLNLCPNCYDKLDQDHFY